MKSAMKLTFLRFTLLLLISFSYAYTSAQTWQPIGTGLGSTGRTLLQDTATGSLLIGGDFVQAGGIPSSFVSRLTQSTYSAVGTGFNGTVQDLMFHDSELYASGTFTMTGVDSTYHIAKWDTVANAWVPILDDMDGYIYDMESYGGYLYVCGSFTQVNGVPMNHTVRFDGVNWSATSMSVSAGSVSVSDFEKDDVGGLYFIQDEVAGDVVKYFNGFTTTPLPVGSDKFFSFLKYIGGILYIGCPSDNTGFLNYLYSWDGSAFSASNYLPANTNQAVNNGVGLSFLGEKDGHLLVGTKPILAGSPGHLLEAVGNSFVMIASSSNGGYFFDVKKYGPYYYTAGAFTSVNGVAANNIARLYFPPPNANFNTSDLTPCSGQTVNFTNTTTSASTYQWHFPGGTPATSTFASPIVVYNTPGDYDVTLVATNTYGTDSITMVNHVHVQPLPAAPSITWSYPYLSSDYAAGNQWYLNGTVIAGATGQQHVPLANGSYTVVYTDASGCSATSGAYFFNMLGNEEWSETEVITIYPNPGSSVLNIQTAFTGEISYKITDISGKTIAAGTLGGPINMTHCSPGIYFVEISDGKNFYQKRWIRY